MINRVLIVSEFFSAGGLESQVAGQIRVLSRASVDFFLATTTTSAHIPDVGFSASLPNLSFGADATSEQLQHSLSEIAAFGRKHDIDLVHCHPFYSLPVGALTAETLEVPFVVTIHSPGNLKSYSTHALEFSNLFVALSEAQKVFCVSYEVQLYLEALFGFSSTHLPNGVSESLTETWTTENQTERWMWAGRIDTRKIIGLMDLVDKIEDLPITLDVFGDGPARQELTRRLAKPMKAQLRFQGWCPEVASRMPQYTIVAGMGRVILEAAASNVTPVLVGYDGVKGVVDEDMLRDAAFRNFSGRAMRTLSTNSFVASLQAESGRRDTSSLRDWVRRNRSEECIWHDYLSRVQNLAYAPSESASALLGALEHTLDTGRSVWTDDSFYELLVYRMHDHYFANTSHTKASLSPDLVVDSAREGKYSATRDYMKSVLARERNVLTHKSRLASQLSAVTAELSALRDRVIELKLELASASTTEQTLRQQLDRAEALREYWEHCYRRVANSFYWRYTAPARVFMKGMFLVVKQPERNLLRLRNLAHISRATGWMDTLKWLWNRLSNRVETFQYGESIQAGHTTYVMSFGHVPNVRKSDLISAVEEGHKVGSPIWVQYYNIVWNMDLFQRPQQIILAMKRIGAVAIYLTDELAENTYLQCADNVFLVNDTCLIEELKGIIVSVYSTATRISQTQFDRVRRTNIVLYEYIDDIDESISGKECISQLMQQKAFFFNGGAQGIVASAKVLLEETQRESRSAKMRYVPNGVDYEHYATALAHKTAVPPELAEFADGYKKVIGYFGALAPWLWYEMINELSEMRSDWGFVFIGPDYRGGSLQLKRRDNVLILDAVAYGILPTYAKRFDVGIIPFRPGKIAQTTSPLKLFEYFALEKAVVVTADMRECVVYSDVFVGSDTREFALGLDRALEAARSETYRQRLRELAKNNSWDDRARSLIEVGQECLRELPD